MSNDCNVVVSGKAGCGGERRKAAISSVAVLMAAVANMAVVPKLVFRHRKPSYIQVALCANDRPLSGLGKSV